MKFLEHEAVLAYRRKIELQEIKLVQKLQQLFEKGDLGRLAQEQMLLLVRLMVSEADLEFQGGHADKPYKVLDFTLDEEKNLQLWDKVVSTGTPLEKMVHVGRRLALGECSLHDCADILRLFGAFVEAGRGHAYIAKMREDKKSGDPLHGAFGKTKNVKNDIYESSLEQESGDQLYRSRGMTGAVRGKVDTNSSNKALDSWATIGRTKGIAGGPLPQHLRGVFDSAHEPTKFSGCNRWSLRLRSKSCQIDKAFGLPFGADISGTTADSVYGLRLAANLSKLHTVDSKSLDFLMLMPLISLVGLYNHTVIECALALMYCGIIDDYHIGYYSTLLPKGCGGKEFASVQQALQAAEDNAERIIVYSRKDLMNVGNTKCLRGFLIEKPEVDKFKPLASAKKFYKDALEYPKNSAKVVAEHLFKSGLADDMLSAIMNYDKRTGRAVNTSKLPNETQYLLKSDETPSTLLTLVHKHIGQRLRKGEIFVF